MTELLKRGLGHLQCYRHPKLLLVLHGPEESPESLAFASEPLIGSLANILSTDASCFDCSQENKPFATTNSAPTKIDYNLIDVEHRYGFAQVTLEFFSLKKKWILSVFLSFVKVFQFFHFLNLHLFTVLSDLLSNRVENCFLRSVFSF